MFSRLKTSRKKVSFGHYAPLAQKVALGGTFNGWEPSKTPLKSDGKGKWRVDLELEPGRYEYRFWVDGDWQNDQRSSVECVPNPFGSWNCVIQVQS